MNQIFKALTLLIFSSSIYAQNNIIISEDFDDSSINSAIIFRPDLEGFDGRVDVVVNEGINGSPGVLMGKFEDSGLTRNSIDINLAIADSSDVYLQFAIKDFFDENHFQDGIFLSNNGGVTFEKVFSFKPEDWCDNVWGEFPAFSLDDLASEIGMTFTNNFVVRIQQYDNANFSTAGDEDGFIIDDIEVFTRHPVYSNLPFVDDFNDGFFKDSWNWAHPDETMFPLICTSKPTGFVGIVDAQGINGTPGVLMGKRCDDGLSANALDLHLNLAELSDVYLSFSILDFFEENHNQDGLFFSNDGGTSFEQVYTFKGGDWCDNIWGEFPPFHVDALAASVGLELTNTFVIRIQQYDNADFSTAGDEDGFIIDNVLVQQRTPVYATLPFEDNFDNSNNGDLGSSWNWSNTDATLLPVECTSKPTGFVGIVDARGLNGTPGVVMGKICDDGLTSNALDLYLNLGGLSDVYLSFSILDFFEENHNQDGLFFSNDGGSNFEQVYTFKGEDWCDNIWGEFPPFHVDALAASVGLELTNTFVIRFQQYDNADFSTAGDEDGFIIDNVLVQQRAPVYATLPFEDNFNNSSNGDLGPSWNWSNADATLLPVECTSKPTGFVGIVDARGTDGTPGIVMGKICDDGLTSNALDLHLNLGGLSDVYLSFSILDFFEENHDQDGLFFSNDGGLSFEQVYTFKGEDWCDNIWGEFPPFHVDALAASVGLELTNTFVIRIQQYDNADFSTAGDEDGFIIDNVLVQQRTPVYATLPFEDNFDNSNNGELGPSWNWSNADATLLPVECTSKPTGFVGIVDAQGINATPGVVMGKRCDDGLTANALDLHLNLAGLSDVYLSFSILDFFEENHNQDGLYFSEDGGVTFQQVYTFRARDWCDNIWGEFPPFHIDALAASVGLELTSSFVVRIQQYDDSDFNTGGDEDGYIIDDVLVQQRTPFYASLPFTDNFDNSINGNLGPSWNWVHADSTVSPQGFTVKPTGFVGIVDAQGTNGTPGLLMGKICDDGLTSNAVDLHLDLEDAQNVLLCFDLLDFSNENNTQDGLFFSNDGGQSFTQIFTFDFTDYPDFQFNPNTITIDLDDLSEIHDLLYTSTCVIRFQQFDDADFSTAGDEDGLILDNFNIKSDFASSVGESHSAQNNFVIFPNPVNDFLQIESKDGLQEIKIIDTKGQIVWQEGGVYTKSKLIDVSNLPNGIYFVQLSNEQGVVLKKMIKTN